MVETQQQAVPVSSTGGFSRVAPAVALFFVAPLIAEFLLGNLPIKLLPALILLAPLYGGGALLIREVVRRSRRGWPSILLMGMAYAVIEEAFTTQSLFNPNYLQMNFHLLDAGYIPSLGIGAWWTLFMLNLHAVWSIGTPIALIEAAVPGRKTTPWLGRTGLIVTSLLFVVGSVAITMMTLRKDPFTASRLQFISAAVVVVGLVAAALVMPRLRELTFVKGGGPVLNAWLTGGLALAFGSAVLLVPLRWGWWAAGAVLALDLIALAVVLTWSRRREWSALNTLSLAAGTALAYAWHAFIEVPVIGGAVMSARIGNAVFALGAVLLIWLAARRTAEARRVASDSEAEVG